jgi:hypothetical protein
LTSDIFEIEFIAVTTESAMALIEECLNLSASQTRPTRDDVIADIDNLDNELPVYRVDSIPIGRHSLSAVLIKMEAAANSGVVVDLSFPIAEGDLSDKQLYEEIHQFSISLADKHRIVDYYGGFEIAADRPTQVFSGPVKNTRFFEKP